MVYNILFSSAYNALQKILLLVAFVASAIFAISLHEYAHGFVAYKMGDPTAKLAGRLTLNPISHFEPIGLVMFLFVGFGFARPVPINPYNFNKLKKGMLLTSFAGVFANLIQALIGFGLLIGFGYLFFTKALTGFLYYLCYFAFYFSLYLTLLNAVLIAFNLLPIYPLDGFRVVETLTPPGNAYVRFMRSYGQYLLIGIVILGFLFDRVNLPQLDLFGQYLSAVQKGILNLFYKNMEGVLA